MRPWHFPGTSFVKEKNHDRNKNGIHKKDSIVKANYL